MLQKNGLQFFLSQPTWYNSYFNNNFVPFINHSKQAQRYGADGKLTFHSTLQIPNYLQIPVFH